MMSFYTLYSTFLDPLYIGTPKILEEMCGFTEIKQS